MVRIYYYLLAVVMAALLFCGTGVAVRAACAQDSVPEDRLSEWNGLSAQERDQLRSSLTTWKQMSQDDRERVLENYKKFKLFPDEQQRKIMENYNRYMRMDPLERKVVRERYKKWNMMSPEQRNLLTSRYDMLIKMRPEDQTQFFENYDIWLRLTADQKEKLFSQWNILTEDEKKLLLTQEQGTVTPKQQREEFKKVIEKMRQNQLERKRIRNEKKAAETQTTPVTK